MKTHDYGKYASDYATIGEEGTYYLLFNAISKLLKEMGGGDALDYGCGAGRSAKLLKSYGFKTIGVDHSNDMLMEARKADLKGEYFLIKSADLSRFKDGQFDIILSTAVFLEISSKEEMERVVYEMKRVLKKDGRIIIGTVLLDGLSSEWTTTNYDFPENKHLKSGDKAKLVFKDKPIILYDYAWTDEDYKEVFKNAGMKTIKKLQPLATGKEPYELLYEKKKPFWTIYVLGK